MKEILAIAAQLCAGRRGGVLATLVSAEGSSYRRPGARMWIGARGQTLGAISGGCLEGDLVLRARQVRSSGLPELVTYDTGADNDLIWGVGMGCNGTVRILLEAVDGPPPWALALRDNLRHGRPTHLRVVWHSRSEPLGTALGRAGQARRPGLFAECIAPALALTIFGAGDDARPLARLAHALGWSVAVADPRPAMATRRRFPEADCLVLGPAQELVERAAPKPGSAVVIMTHRYLHDLPVLRRLVHRPLAYVGLLGPKLRAERLLGELEADGLKVPAHFRRSFRAPVGLDIGAEGAEEVALSIVAEIMAVIAERDARPLRERSLPIHG